MVPIIISVVVFVLIILGAVFGLASYVKAPPDMAYIISGFHKKPRILIGKAGFKIPFFERLDKLALGAVQIDVKTSSSVPTAEYINVRVDSNVNVRVGQSPEMIELASQNFLNVPKEEINRKVRDLLEGNVREIVGQMKLTDMVSDRKAFSEKVQENAVPDLARFGLELVSFNVQNFVDDNQVIDNLGIDNVEQIRKKAAIAKSDAKREIAIAAADNAKQANAAKAQAQEAINERNAQMETKKAELKRKVDTQQAQADAAKDIEAENQRKLKDVAATDANIAKAEREAELKQKEIQLKEYELDALVRKQADAEKYAAEQNAEADRIRRQKDAEAKAYEIKQNAEAKAFEIQQEAQARKAKADADKYAAEQEAAGIAAKGSAEAKAILDKAEAQKQMGQASVLEMVLKTLPEMTRAAAEPLNNIDNMTVYGSDGGSKLVGDVMQSTNQILEALKANGIDLSALTSSFIGGTIASSTKK